MDTEIRTELLETIRRSFAADLLESIKPLTQFEDRDYFLKTLLEYIGKEYNSYEPNEYFDTELFDGGEFIQERLLNKFRDKMVPFVKCSLEHYFSKDEFYQSVLFKKLKIDEPVFTFHEYEDHISNLANLLSKFRKIQALQSPDKHGAADIKKLTESEEPKTKIKNPEFSRSRQALLLYYVLKIMRVEIRKDSFIAPAARFGHALSAWPYTDINNSSLYDIMKRVPMIKPDKELLVDLEWVKGYFAEIKQAEGIELVQKEIDSIKKTR